MRSRQRILTLPVLLLLLAPLLGAQDDNGQQQPPPTRRVTRPGLGPQIPFDESRWEFWWYFNREFYVGLRRSLDRQAADSADADFPLEPVSGEDRRRKILPHLVQALRDPNPFVRAAVVHALAKTHEPDVRPYLFHALRDEDFQVRLQAVLALGVWGDTVALPRIEEILADPKRELQVRLYAAVALGLVGGEASESFRAFLSPSVFGGLPVMIQAAVGYGVGLTHDTSQAAALRNLLADERLDNLQVRSNLVLSLGKCGTAADEPFLVEALGHPESQVRRSAALALAVLREGRPDDVVVGALARASGDDADLLVRSFSYLALGRIGGDEAVSHLRRAFDRETQQLRTFVALALGLAHDAGSRDRLVSALKEEGDLSLRGSLAVALGLLGDPTAAPALREIFTQVREPVLRGYAALALGMLGDVESIASLRASLSGANDVEFLPRVATALGLLGDRAAARLLVQRAADERNEYVRQSLLYAVGLIGDRSAVDPLIAILSDPSEVAYMREYAAVALGMLVDRGPVRAIARASHDSNYTVAANFLNEIFSVL